MENKFNEEDKIKFINFLNSVANHAEFKMDTKQLCEYFKLLAHMQQVILPKLDANIFEIIKVGEIKPKAKSKSKSK